MSTLRELIEQCTPGPWKVVEEIRDLLGGHKTTDRMITQVHDHPQLKAPLPVVTNSYSVGPDGKSLVTVYIRPEDAALIARLNPQTALLVLEAIEGALSAMSTCSDTRNGWTNEGDMRFDGDAIESATNKLLASLAALNGTA